MNNVKQHLRELGVSGMTISTVSGWSKQRELHLQWRGMPVSYDLIQRCKFEIVASDSQVDDIVHAIVETARTAEIDETMKRLQIIIHHHSYLFSSFFLLQISFFSFPDYKLTNQVPLGSSMCCLYISSKKFFK